MVPYRILNFAILLSVLLTGAAQILCDPEINSVLCPQKDGNYCLHGSLNGPTIIVCASSAFTEVYSCNEILTTVLSDDYQSTATCYETFAAAGDALCAFNGTGYSLSDPALSIQVPETLLCEHPDEAGEGEAPSTASAASFSSVITSSETEPFAEPVTRITSTSTHYITVTVIARSTTQREPAPTTTLSAEPTHHKRNPACSNPRTQSPPAHWPTPTPAPMTVHALAALPTPITEHHHASSTTTSTIFLYKGSPVPPTFSPMETSGTDIGTGLSRVTVIVTLTAKPSRTTTITLTSTGATTTVTPTRAKTKTMTTSGSEEIRVAVWSLFWVVVFMAVLCLSLE
ncbi:uncharacterized protein BO97DRAFT_465946 [Aspergillus homomorphus CBS 101889]|uniref:Uncharacterized protein n=1 Tax=Aspergillus homomorphus (strain CBS 101889) TaxID=1450537 RepID=A0A395I297_ASPHC|nr:hypothetical protein BO97DRAFT_465946 [Aspergillus homomorphus CBS 101889]RAL14291.1 hypothetical protein BO97DRAFT_465946 [Aspergillus homomorphus CBS 101889]